MAEPLNKRESDVYNIILREGPISTTEIERRIGIGCSSRPGASGSRLLRRIMKKGWPIIGKRISERGENAWYILEDEYRIEGDDETKDRYFELKKRDTIWEIITTKDFKNPEEAMAYAGMDPTVWRCVKIDLGSNEWDVSAKVEDGWSVHTNKQTKRKFTFERKIPIPIEDGIEAFLCNRIKPPKFRKIKRTPPKDPHMLIVSMPDAHFGMLAWEEECGTSYNTKIASRLFIEAGKTLLNRSAGYNIEKILLPMGNDLFHMNDITAMTPKRKNKLDVDNRIAKVFNYIIDAHVDLIAFFREYAPVEVVWVKGNHDPDSSYYAAKVLEYYYKSLPEDEVLVNTDPTPRKYVKYGVNLIAWTHGDEEPHRDLAGIMAGEVPKLWSKTKFREWHLGHNHKKKEMFTVIGDELRNGVRTRIIPSLSAKDYWHTSKGYMSIRSAEGHLYSKTNGPSGYFSVNVFNNEILGKSLGSPSCNR